MGKKTISIAGYLWICKKYGLINEIQIKIIRIINFYLLKYIQPCRKQNHKNWKSQEFEINSKKILKISLL